MGRGRLQGQGAGGRAGAEVEAGYKGKEKEGGEGQGWWGGDIGVVWRSGIDSLKVIKMMRARKGGNHPRPVIRDLNAPSNENEGGGKAHSPARGVGNGETQRSFVSF